MSWSIAGRGTAAELIEKTLPQFDAPAGYCQEPERSIVVEIQNLLKGALDATPPGRLMELRAHGSQQPMPEGKAINTFLVELSDVYPQPTP